MRKRRCKKPRKRWRTLSPVTESLIWPLTFSIHASNISMEDIPLLSFHIYSRPRRTDHQLHTHHHQSRPKARQHPWRPQKTKEETRNIEITTSTSFHVITPFLPILVPASETQLPPHASPISTSRAVPKSLTISTISAPKHH
ncbi:hypothetical protein BDR22DRAFT_671631 [Usnea florida]